MNRIVLALACVVGFAVAASPAHAQSSSSDKQEREQAAAINTQLAVEYLKQNNLPAARTVIDKALKQNPKTAETQMTAGMVYDRFGDDKKALQFFNEAARLGKDNPDVLNNVAVYLCRKGERKRGEELFLKSATSPLYKTPAVAYTNAGRCARADGRPADAEKYFRKALSLRPDQSDSLLALAEVTHDQGNHLQSRAFLQRYLAVAPASAGTLLLGYRVETALGDAAAAGDYAERLRKQFPDSNEAAALLQEQGAKP